MADETFFEHQARTDGEAEATFIEGVASQHHGFQPLPPTLIAEGYRVVKELGLGAEAQVWLCTNANQHNIAVKMYFREPKYTFALDSPEYRMHFSPEWTVEVLRRGTDRVAGTEKHYEVMEYCEFGTLEDLIATRESTDELATAIVERLSSCVTSLQGEKRNVVHGDLKPRNVLVRNAERIELVLSDFGLTIDLGERSNLSNLGQGTTAYNAPEILRRKGVPADWWSLGMVVYTVLVGRGYYQLDVDRWLNQSAIEADLISRDVSLAALDRLQMPEDRQQRWKLLLAGLLTRDPGLRWGASEVESWVAGESPQVHRQLDAIQQPLGDSQSGRVVEPFPFAGAGEFSSPQALGEAMAARPQDAARMLGGKGTARLVGWLRDDVRTGDDYSELDQHSWDPDAKVTYFLARMAPNVPLTFRGQPISTPGDLRRLVEAEATGVIDALYAAELIGSLANDGARSTYRMIEANWQDLVGRAVDAARTRSISISDEVRGQICRHALLLAASDSTVADHYAEAVLRRVATEAMSPASEVDWFVRLQADGAA